MAARGNTASLCSTACELSYICRFGKPRPDNPAQRTQLWMELLGLIPRFQGNQATNWGSQNERQAIQKVVMQMNKGTSQLYQCGFDVLQDTDKHGRMMSWLGASPDGLILPEGQASSLEKYDSRERPVSCPPLDVHDSQAKGVLEVKCPYNLRSKAPYDAWPEYYLPQVLTNMAVFRFAPTSLRWFLRAEQQSDYLNIHSSCRAQYAYMACWTPQGLSLFYVEKHQAFWDEVRHLREKHYSANAGHSRHIVMRMPASC
jgi:YqaJ-like viral recombinase domain